jgi:tetratricopeptide (TPR) repeat protein
MLISLENTSEFFDKHLSVISDGQFCLIEDVTLGIKQSVTFTDKEIAELDKKLSERITIVNQIRTVAKNNNKGIEFERIGETAKAIQIYEENILSGYPATRSYDRLIILYKRLKRYDDEIRIIKKAIEVFSKENEYRFEKAFYNSSDITIRAEIKRGMINNKSVKGINGYLFVPYDIKKWVKRLEREMKKI